MGGWPNYVKTEFTTKWWFFTLNKNLVDFWVLWRYIVHGRYMHIIYYDILSILELQVYLPSEDNFYSYLSMLSSIAGRDDKIKLSGWGRILFNFYKKIVSVN